jgi:hypothetical protein
MLVMSDVTDPWGVHTMTKGEGKSEVIDLKGLLGQTRTLCERRSRRWFRRHSRRR